MRPDLVAAISGVTGAPVVGFAPLGGGCVGRVYRVDLADGNSVVAKIGGADSGLAVEGFMLRYLARAGLPVPEVLHADDRLLLMGFVATDGGLTAAAEADAAELLARLHSVTAEGFGFERSTRIGGLVQPNPWTPGWIDFFAEHRLLAMGRRALEARRLPPRLMGRIESLAGRLGRWLAEPAAPSLIHGDVWGGNVLARGGRIAAFVDPAIYFADSEIELAFATLFGTFGRPFFDRYHALRPLRPGFFEERRDLYNLYPLLVHVRLFGGSYVGEVERTLERFGC